MRRPVVIGHFAVTADGKTSTRNFTPSLFTSPRDKSRLQEVRASADAVLVGRGTVAIDSMSMGLSRVDLREKRVKSGRSPVPIRVLMSNSGRLDVRWKVFRYTASPLIVFSTSQMTKALRDKIAPFCELYLFSGGEVSIPVSLTILREDYGVRRLVCEGGGTLFKALVKADVIDEIFLTVAPIIFGGKDAPTLTGRSGNFLPDIHRFSIEDWDSSGGECYLHLRRRGKDSSQEV